jgi:transcriptional regulator GlxA family with amidase domain
MNDQEHTLELLAQLMVLQVQQSRHGPEFFVPNGRDHRLRLAIDILQQDPGRNFSLDELAARAHTSAPTLARLFSSETNMTVGRWCVSICA